MRIEARKAPDNLQSPETGHEEYLKALFDAVHTGILVIDPALHRIVDVNPAAARLFGCTAEDLTGESLNDFLVKDSVAWVEASARALADRPQGRPSAIPPCSTSAPLIRWTFRNWRPTAR